MKPPYAIGSVPSLSGHAVAYRWRSLPRVRRHRASKPQGSSERVLPWQITMDQLIFASLSHTHYWYEVGMLKVPAVELSGCSTQPGECATRYAHGSLRTNYVSKLGVAYERDLGIITDWSDALRIGNPVRSDLVTQYMTFTREEQKKTGVAVKQAPAVLPSHLYTIVSPLRARLQHQSDPCTRVVLAWDLTLFTVAFETTKRGDELNRTLIQRILRLPNHNGFLF